MAKQYVTHLCSFPGTRSPDPLPVGYRERCDGPSRIDSRKRCSKRGEVGVIFAWGAAVLCRGCADVECGPSVPM